ncbi:MAG: SCO family protein [Pirellulaceae bacterium]|nr:SCO family protein [Pirellulaceae bacterium]
MKKPEILKLVFVICLCGFGLSAMGLGTLIYLKKKEPLPTDPHNTAALTDPNAQTAENFLLSKKIAPFTLIDQSEQEFKSDQLTGKLWVCNFFFASCPTVCKNLNIEMGKLQSEFSSDELSLVSITVDPEKDTPQSLANYGENLGALKGQWFFLTGNIDDILAIGQNLKLGLQKQTHTERMVLINREGKVAGLYKYDNLKDQKDLRKEIKRLLSEVSNPTDEK